MMKRRVFLMLAAALLTGCDAFVTGEQVVAFDLKPQADGGYAPVTVTLGPEMNPVALNLRAELPGSGGTPGAWNEYAAMLTFNGAPVATNSFTVNDTPFTAILPFSAMKRDIGRDTRNRHRVEPFSGVAETAFPTPSTWPETR